MKTNLLVHAAIAGLVAAAGVAAVSTAESLADSGGGTKSVFVPIAPCRLVDTRGGQDTIGPRSTPLTANETVTFQVWGTNGNCSIPTSATGIGTNVTIDNPDSDSYLTVFPADVPRPLSSNLNWTSSSAPTPNAVTVGLSATGAIGLFNNAGNVDVIVDIVGYYEASTGSGNSGPLSVTGAEIVDESVTGADVKDYSLTGADIHDYTIDTNDLTPFAVKNGNIASNAIDGAQIKDGSLTNLDISVFSAQIDDDGTVLQSTNPVTVTLGNDGEYTLDYNMEIDSCAVVASQGGTFDAAEPLLVGTRLFPPTDLIEVALLDRMGIGQNSKFTVVLVC